MSDAKKLEEIKQVLKSNTEPLQVGMCAMNTEFNEGRASLAKELLDDFFYGEE